MVPYTSGTPASGISGSSYTPAGSSVEQSKIGIASRAPAIQQNSNPVQNPYTAGNSTNPSTKIAEKRRKSLGDNSPLVFPPELSSEYYISFNAFKHSQSRPEELKRKFKFDKSVFLPIPTNISDSYSAAYNAENLYIGGELARKGIDSILQKDGTSSLSNAMQNLTPDFLGNAAASGLKALANDPGGVGSKAAATAAVLAMSGSGGQLASAARASFPVSTNPFPVMIFQGTSFKPAFSFDWVFYPESLEEAQTIRKIIGYFRREMLPETMEGNESILKTPAIFELAMKPNEYTRQFKKCVLKDMAVNYAPNGPSFIINDDNEANPSRVPSAVSLSLTFQEIEVWLADDYYDDEYNAFGPRDKSREESEKASSPGAIRDKDGKVIDNTTNALGVPQNRNQSVDSARGTPFG